MINKDLEWKKKALEYAKAKIWIDDIEYQISISIDIAIRSFFNKMLDPEIIANNSNSIEERMAINNYLRNWLKTLKDVQE